MKIQKQGGFTLIELVVVIALLGILAAFAIPRFASLEREARSATLILQMIALGEETGALPELMNEVSDYYKREVDYDLENLSAALEPILIVSVGAIVLILALGVFLPMWDMVGRAKAG